MSIEGLMIALVALLIVGLWVALPLVGRPQGDVEEERVEKQRERLATYYERVLRNVRDLDEDHITGKIDAERHAVEREIWVQRGMQALKLLDQLETEQVIVAPDFAVDDIIETAVARYRSKSHPAEV